MKILVCGPRKWVNPKPIEDALRQFARGSVLIHGAASGVDTIAGDVGKMLGFLVRDYPVNHRLDGPWPGAGPRRNGRMLAAEHPNTDDGSVIEVGIAFKPPSGLTAGTGNMVARMMRADPPIRILEIGAKPR